MTVVMAARSANRGRAFVVVATVVVLVVISTRRGKGVVLLCLQLRLEVPHAAAQLQDLVAQAAADVDLAIGRRSVLSPEPSR